MNNCKVTIVTVCYNSESTIEDTILSVIGQTYDNIEYIVIDGASKDRTLEIIEKYKDNISLIVSEPDNGIYDAMNKGIQFASGEWINFMNSGDIFATPNVISDVFKTKFDDNIGVIYGDTILKYPNGYYHLDCTPSDDFNQITHQSAFTKVGILKQIKYDLTFKIMADANSFKQIKKLGYELKHIKKDVSIYESSSGISAQSGVRMYIEKARISGCQKGFKWYTILLKLIIYNFLVEHRIIQPKKKHLSRKFVDNPRIRKVEYI